jgi:hypothetical protein
MRHEKKEVGVPVTTSSEFFARTIGEDRRFVASIVGRTRGRADDTEDLPYDDGDPRPLKFE